MHIYQSGLKEVDEEVVEKLTYEHYTIHDDDVQQIPLKWYEAQPIFSKKIVMMHLQLRP